MNSPRVKTSVQLSSPTPWYVVAAVCFAVAAVMTIFTVRFLARSVPATATVTGLHEVAGGDDGKTSFAPEYQFTAPDGRQWSGVSNSGSNPPAYAVGQKIRIRYDRNYPYPSRIDSFSGLWGFAFGFALGGVGSLLLGLIMKRARRRKAHVNALAAK